MDPHKRAAARQLQALATVAQDRLLDLMGWQRLPDGTYQERARPELVSRGRASALAIVAEELAEGEGEQQGQVGEAGGAHGATIAPSTTTGELGSS